MKNNEKVIGLIAGVVLSVICAALGLQTDAIKAGICSAPVVVPAPAPSGVSGVVAPSQSK